MIWLHRHLSPALSPFEAERESRISFVYLVYFVVRSSELCFLRSLLFKSVSIRVHPWLNLVPCGFSPVGNIKPRNTRTTRKSDLSASVSCIWCISWFAVPSFVPSVSFCSNPCPSVFIRG